jgi:uncharacterized membrane protein (DUF4010 family)
MLIVIALALITNTILKIILAYVAGGKKVAISLAYALAPATVGLIVAGVGVIFFVGV